MDITESFTTALDAILANRMRSILTMLGVIIGVASVIALMAIGNGFSEDITNQITSIGTNLINVSTDVEGSGGYQALSFNDVEALSDPLNVPSVSDITAKIDGNVAVVFGGESKTTTVSGIMANYLEMNSLDEFQLGDGLTNNDLDTSARVAVLGAGIASELFGTEFPVGEQIRINGVSYEVVGVLEESGGGLAGNTDDTVYVPLTTAQSRLYTDRTRSGDKIVSSITMQAADSESVEQAINEITKTLRDRHGINYGDDDDFRIFDQSSLLDTVNTVIGSMTAFLGAIAAISLVVGGIGIMNIMLVSVTERTREIGIRKAIGALRRDILTQFLLESMVLSLLGGAIGIMLGWAISSLAGTIFDLTMAIDLGTVLLSASFAAAVGLIFGIYPAWRASNLRPIEALRYE
ncbi:MAG: FtsX-like permease family protein [Chloroflexi bacterium]|jgi:putative ABC transport system permease protein|nr:FtsX-like permease family protein [Chloroflexota bacterium]